MLWNLFSKAFTSFFLVLVVSQIGFSQGTDWRLSGNNGTNPTTNFLGTTDNISLVFRTNNLPRLRITNTGNVGIGTATPTSLLTVAGLIETTGIGIGGIMFPNGTVQNTAGVTSVTASGPLFSSGGLTPNISLTGVVGAGNGGTGLNSAGVAGNFLRSDGSSWISAPLTLNATLTGNGTISNPLGVAIQGVDTARLADGAVTIGKLAAGSATAEQVLTFDGVNMVWATPQPTGSGFLDPALVATLRWDLLPRAYGDIAVGNTPQGVAFDGANIWVANETSNTVTKLRASDGVILNSFAAGNGPRAVAFDGTHIWVANQNSNNVTKLRASDGANLGTFAVGTFPVAIAFDGASIWVANTLSDDVTRLRASDGANLGTFAVGDEPGGVAFDGTSIWVTNFISDTVTRLRASDGANLGAFAVGDGPIGIAFDGVSVWVANYVGHSVTKLRASDGANLGSFGVVNPWGVTFDGKNIWVVGRTSNNVTKLRASDGANLTSVAVGSDPRGVVFDGTHIWVANSSSNTISKR